MKCARCRQDIPPERLEAVPGATLCVSCLRATGDVPVKKGRLVFDHKTGGQLEVLSDPALQALRQAEGAVEDRVSRL